MQMYKDYYIRFSIILIFIFIGCTKESKRLPGIVIANYKYLNYSSDSKSIYYLSTYSFRNPDRYVEYDEHYVRKIDTQENGKKVRGLSSVPNSPKKRYVGYYWKKDSIIEIKLDTLIKQRKKNQQWLISRRLFLKDSQFIDYQNSIVFKNYYNSDFYLNF